MKTFRPGVHHVPGQDDLLLRRSRVARCRKIRGVSECVVGGTLWEASAGPATMTYYP